MKVVVIGGGAMGGLFATHLARTDAELWVYDHWREHVEAIARDGLRVEHLGNTRVTALRATTDATVPGVADLAIVFVKFGQTRAALGAARPMIGSHTVVVTLQNGIGNVEIIRAMLPNRILFGNTTLTSDVLGPGRIASSHAAAGESFLWPLDGVLDAQVQAIHQLLVAAGLTVHLAPDIELRIWQKLVINCCLNTMCAIAGSPVGVLVDQPGVWPVLEGVTDEIVTAAHCAGVPLERAAALDYLRLVAEQARLHAPSMLADIRQRRCTEIDSLNGAVLQISARHQLQAPYNQLLYTLIRAIETSWSS